MSLRRRVDESEKWMDRQLTELRDLLGKQLSLINHATNVASCIGHKFYVSHTKPRTYLTATVWVSDWEITRRCRHCGLERVTYSKDCPTESQPQQEPTNEKCD